MQVSYVYLCIDVEIDSRGVHVGNLHRSHRFTHYTSSLTEAVHPLQKPFTACPQPHPQVASKLTLAYSKVLKQVRKEVSQSPPFPFARNQSSKQPPFHSHSIQQTARVPFNLKANDAIPPMIEKRSEKARHGSVRKIDSPRCAGTTCFVGTLVSYVHF